MRDCFSDRRPHRPFGTKILSHISDVRVHENPLQFSRAEMVALLFEFETFLGSTFLLRFEYVKSELSFSRTRNTQIRQRQSIKNAPLRSCEESPNSLVWCNYVFEPKQWYNLTNSGLIHAECIIQLFVICTMQMIMMNFTINQPMSEWKFHCAVTPAAWSRYRKMVQ